MRASSSHRESFLPRAHRRGSTLTRPNTKRRLRASSVWAQGATPCTPERGQGEPHGASDGQSAVAPPASGPAQDLRRPAGVAGPQTSRRNYPESCPQGEPKRPKGDAVRRAKLRGVARWLWRRFETGL
jgi:hypothetical protein